jgi:hypothetical protein
MKLKFTLIVILIIAITPVFAQNTITGTGTVSKGAPTNDLARSAWYRGGNFLGGVTGANNVFGGLWPLLLRVYKKSIMLKLYGIYIYGLNGASLVVSRLRIIGYVPTCR